MLNLDKILLLRILLGFWGWFDLDLVFRKFYSQKASCSFVGKLFLFEFFELNVVILGAWNCAIYFGLINLL